MPKVKIPRKSTAQDMTAMCDVAFLLLTFFMLTSKFTAQEVIQVSTPSSISEIKIPDVNVCTILIDKDGRVYLGIDKPEDRKSLLEGVGDRKKITFTKTELKKFSLVPNYGVPVEKMKAFLAQEQQDRDKLEQDGPNKGKSVWHTGIPCDSLDNQLKLWVYYARSIKGKQMRIAIKADSKTPYSVVKKVMNSLQDIKESRYNLITTLEEAPKGI